jgi:hypothetical protein
MKEEKSVAINHDTRVLNPSYMGKAALPSTNNNILQRKFILSQVLRGASKWCFFPSPSWEREEEEEREIKTFHLVRDSITTLSLGIINSQAGTYNF